MRCRRFFCAVLEQHCPTVDVEGRIVCEVCGKSLHRDPCGGWYCPASQHSAVLVKLLVLFLAVSVAYGIVEELLLEKWL